MQQPSSHLLRKGRVSIRGYFYLITAVTCQRKQFFLDFDSARMIVNALRYSDESNWTETFAFVVMPDHMHWLFQLAGERDLARVMQSVKSYSARRIPRPSGGQIWQHGFHDRAIRTYEELKATARYVVANPLRAGLVKKIGDYPWWDVAWI